MKSIINICIFFTILTACETFPCSEMEMRSLLEEGRYQRAYDHLNSCSNTDLLSGRTMLDMHYLVLTSKVGNFSKDIDRFNTAFGYLKSAALKGYHDAVVDLAWSYETGEPELGIPANMKTYECLDSVSKMQEIPANKVQNCLDMAL